MQKPPTYHRQRSNQTTNETRNHSFIGDTSFTRSNSFRIKDTQSTRPLVVSHSSNKSNLADKENQPPKSTAITIRPIKKVIGAGTDCFQRKGDCMDFKGITKLQAIS
jgi:hypothetical protein